MQEADKSLAGGGLAAENPQAIDKAPTPQDLLSACILIVEAPATGQAEAALLVKGTPAQMKAVLMRGSMYQRTTNFSLSLSQSGRHIGLTCVTWSQGSTFHPNVSSKL